MAQPAATFQSRELVRAAPFSTPVVFVGSLGAGLTTSAGFDVYQALSDRNQINTITGQVQATGFVLDVAVFSSQAGTLDVQTLASFAAANRSVMPGGTPAVIAASTLGLVAGLRVIGQFCFVFYSNTAGVAANVEFTAIIRSQ